MFWLGFVAFGLDKIPPSQAKASGDKSLFAVEVGDNVSLGLYIKKVRAVVLVCSHPCVVSYFMKNKESLASHGRLKDVLGLGVFDELCAWRLS